MGRAAAGVRGARTRRSLGLPGGRPTAAPPGERAARRAPGGAPPGWKCAAPAPSGAGPGPGPGPQAPGPGYPGDRRRPGPRGPRGLSPRGANGYLELLVLALIQQLFETKGTFCHDGHGHLPSRSRRRACPRSRPQAVPRGVAPGMTSAAGAAWGPCAGAASVPARRRHVAAAGRAAAAALAGALGALEDRPDLPGKRSRARSLQGALQGAVRGWAAAQRPRPGRGSARSSGSARPAPQPSRPAGGARPGTWGPASERSAPGHGHGHGHGQGRRALQTRRRPSLRHPSRGRRATVFPEASVRSGCASAPPPIPVAPRPRSRASATRRPRTGRPCCSDRREGA